MSTNSSLWVYYQLFKETMRANGWTDKSPDYDEEQKYLEVQAEKNISTDKKVQLTIKAWRSRKHRCMFIRRFRFYSTGKEKVPVLGAMTLPYYGKEEWKSNNVGASRTKHWVLEKPVDLLSLFEAHSRIAKATGNIPILN